MAKKSRRNMSVKKAAPHHVRGNVVHAGFDDTSWHPLEEQIDRNRDQSYLKKVKPRTEGQRALMEAIEQYNLTLAMGPAGSGKTYLAISAAVDALMEGKVERIILSRPAMEADTTCIPCGSASTVAGSSMAPPLPPTVARTISIPAVSICCRVSVTASGSPLDSAASPFSEFSALGGSAWHPASRAARMSGDAAR